MVTRNLTAWYSRSSLWSSKMDAERGRLVKALVEEDIVRKDEIEAS